MVTIGDLPRGGARTRRHISAQACGSMRCRDEPGASFSVLGQRRARLHGLRDEILGYVRTLADFDHAVRHPHLVDDLRASEANERKTTPTAARP